MILKIAIGGAIALAFNKYITPHIVEKVGRIREEITGKKSFKRQVVDTLNAGIREMEDVLQQAKEAVDEQK